MLATDRRATIPVYGARQFVGRPRLLVGGGYTRAVEYGDEGEGDVSGC